MFRDCGKWGFLIGQDWARPHGHWSLRLWWDRTPEPKEGELIWKKELSITLGYHGWWGWLRQQNEAGQYWKIGIEYCWFPLIIMLNWPGGYWNFMPWRHIAYFRWIYPHLKDRI